MGKITGFIEYHRLSEAAQPVDARVKHYREFIVALKDDEASKQGARCMDCGIPFCQTGCPVNNIIPDRNGGLLRYGIPDFKMEKHLIDLRIEQMEAEGVEFRVNQHVGGNVPAKDLLDEFDAIALTGGAEQPRDLPVPGRELDGVHFAM